MKNKLKGVTLLETVLYIGLFSIILFIVVNFMLTAQESSRRTNESERLHRTKHFISQHIDYSFQNSDEIDETNSIFDNDLGGNNGLGNIRSNTAGGALRFYLRGVSHFIHVDYTWRDIRLYRTGYQGILPDDTDVVRYDGGYGSRGCGSFHVHGLYT